MKSGSNVLAVAISAVFLSACGDFSHLQEGDLAIERGALNQTFTQHQAACQADPRVQSGVVSLTECTGADIFFKETFNGNGRTCGTCHPAENNLTIDPAFIATLPANDPLFVAEFMPALSKNFENPILMRQFGLILENVDGFDH